MWRSIKDNNARKKDLFLLNNRNFEFQIILCKLRKEVSINGDKEGNIDGKKTIFLFFSFFLC